MTEMTKGGNLPVTSGSVRATLFWSGGADVPEVDASALLLQADGRVSSDADFVFYNQPEHITGTVKHAGKQSGPQAYDVIDIDLEHLPTTVDRITLAASTESGTFGQVPGLRLSLSDLFSGTELASFAMSAAEETAYVTGELYRRAGGWKFRAVGQGYAAGLAGLAADFGIDVGGSETDEGGDGPGEGAADASATPAPVLPPPSFAPPGADHTAVPEPAFLDLTPPAPEPAAASLDLTPPAPEPAAASLDLTPPAPEPAAPVPASLDLTPPAGVSLDVTLTAPAADAAAPWPAPPAAAPSWTPPPPAAGAAAWAAPPETALTTAGPLGAPPPPPPPPPAWSAPEPPPPPASPSAAEPSPPPPPAWSAPEPPPPPAEASGAAGPSVRTLDDGAVELRRNERVLLTSASTGPLSRVMLDLAWQPAPGRLSVDLDASVIAFDTAAKKLEIVWYQHQNEFSGALQHTGDAKGEPGGVAAERLLIDLLRLPDHVHALVFTINSFHGHTFTDLQRAFCVLSDDSGRPIVHYDLTDTQPSTAVLMAVLHRSGQGTWQMRAIGEYHDCRTVKKLVDPAARQAGIL